MINGSPSNEFKMQRGLRQQGFPCFENGAKISLLLYADDKLFFGKRSSWNVKNLIHNLICFELGSGFKVNLAKSRILGVGIPIDMVEEVLASLSYAHDSLPFSYLRLPFSNKLMLYRVGTQLSTGSEMDFLAGKPSLCRLVEDLSSLSQSWEGRAINDVFDLVSLIGNLMLFAEALLNRLPKCVNFAFCGITLTSFDCPLRNTVDEDVDH
ncbi:hypothetical protein Tco_0085284 [Tanacetum coccineum]